MGNVVARINVEKEFWDDPRLKALQKLFAKDPNTFQYAEYIAVGAVVCLWKLAQNYVTDAGSIIPKDVFETIEANSKLIEAKLAKLEQEGFFIEGSKKHLAWLHKKRESAAKGGAAKSEKKLKNLKNHRSKTEADSKQTQASSNPTSYILHSHPTSSFSDSSLNLKNEEILPSAKSLGAQVWDAYAEAFQKRYGVTPPRNAKTNSQCSQLASRLGQDAIEVVRFYLGHNDAWYLKRQHDLGSALQAAESLHTQWQRNAPVTGAQVRQFEKQSTNMDLLEKVRKGEV